MATKLPPAAEVEPSESPPQKSTHAGIVRSAGIVSAAVLLSRITGLVREVVLARFFGASMVFDAFLAAFRIPNLMRDLLAEGALSAAFVTTFSQELSAKGDEAAFRLSNLLATVLVPMLAVLCLLGIIFAPQVVDVMFPGFDRSAGQEGTDRPAGADHDALPAVHRPGGEGDGRAQLQRAVSACRRWLRRSST